MLENWFILIPEIIILSFFLIGWLITKFRQIQTPKTFSTLAQILLLLVILFSILFYNKSVFPLWWQNTSFTTTFKIFTYLLALAWFYLSSKWFLNKNRPSFHYYADCFGLLLGLDILSAVNSLLILSITIPFICYFYRQLILRHWDIERVAPIAKSYGIVSFFFCLLLWIGTSIIYIQSKTFSYQAIEMFFASQTSFSWLSLFAVLMILSCFIFLIGLAPFHIWFIATISDAVLPVCGFITLVPPLIYICALINIMLGCFEPFIGFLSPLITIFAVISLILGAVSANNENNIRKKFGFLSIYCIGFTIVGLVNFSGAAIMASFAYIVIAILSLAGVYTVFLGMKSRGEYVSNISETSGFYQVRPYMAAALLIFMCSLIGLAPTLGFFGYLSIINYLISNNLWWQILILLCSSLFVAGSCFQVIRALYFEPLTGKFDRADKAIYICLFINVTFILVSLINPTWLINDALIILGGIS